MTTAVPDWLQARLARALGALGEPPDPTAAITAIAAHHGCGEGEVVVTHGTVDAEALLARVLGPGAAPGVATVHGLPPAWALEGLLAGYLLAPPELATRLRAAQGPAPVGTLALTALEALAPVPPRRPGSGHVTLIGAGPGDPLLLTRRAWLALHAADVVVTDRLVDESLLAGLAPDVTVVDAGKAPGAHRLTQEQINDAIVSWARTGAQVARLKGGDPFVFGRGAEEVLACAEAAVPVTVIPGLSSATAAPTLAGIPVTHRGIGRSFAVLSGHLPPGHPANPVDWAVAAATVDTLVLLMAIGNLSAITEAVLSVRPPESPAAVIQQAGTAAQQVTTCRLDELPSVAARNPAVVVIGPTVGVL